MRHKILLLDDDPSRHAAFCEVAEGYDVVQTYCLATFSEALQDPPWPSLISLDHDLGGGVNANRQYHECGCGAAELVVAAAPKEIPVLIHSANDPCAQVMRKILVAGGRSGRVSCMNIQSIMALDERGGLAILEEAIHELLARPCWPEDVTTEDLLDLLCDDPTLTCPVKAANR